VNEEQLLHTLHTFLRQAGITSQLAVDRAMAQAPQEEGLQATKSCMPKCGSRLRVSASVIRLSETLNWNNLDKVQAARVHGTDT